MNCGGTRWIVKQLKGVDTPLPCPGCPECPAGGPFDPNLTWTCHVCGDERPDAQISVHKVEATIDDRVSVTANVRYCNDRAACRERAETVGRRWLDQPGGVVDEPS